jgi:hypothetical protein
MSTDTEKIQAAHDLTVHAGATCGHVNISKALVIGREASEEAEERREIRRIVKSAEALQHGVATRYEEKTYAATESQLKQFARTVSQNTEEAIAERKALATGELPTVEQLRQARRHRMAEEIKAKGFLFRSYPSEYPQYRQHFLLAQKAGLI